MSSDVNHTDSPLEQFIREVVEPRREEMNRWKHVKKHQGILLEDAEKRRRTVPTKLGPSYVLVNRGTQIGGIDSRTTTLVSAQARDATQSIDLSHSYLRASQVSTAPGRSFHVSHFEAAENYRKGSDSPVTVRPSFERARPVTALAVSSSEELWREWQRATQAVRHLKGVNQLIQVESYSPDLPLRIYVVGERAVAAVARIPFYLAGDGSSTVHQLLDADRQRRRECEYLGSRILSVGVEHLVQMRLTLEDVLPTGEIRILEAAPEAEVGGGLSVDVFDNLSEELKDLAIDAMWAFPGLTGTAVDIITPSLESAEGARVAHVVPTADVGEFLYPAYGEPRRCGVNMIDQMIHGR